MISSDFELVFNKAASSDTGAMRTVGALYGLGAGALPVCG